jgi:tRNA(Ile)-lysidine synthase
LDQATLLIRETKSFIELNRLLSPGDHVLAAVSGGPDSMALLAVLSELRPGLSFRLSVAHLNHGLREEAGEEERFVRAVCDKLRLDFAVERTDTRSFAAAWGLSVEEAARELRYKFLKDAAQKLGCSKVALGHTADDQAETVLMRLIRGAGVRGLSAMKPVADEIFIRPLLSARREVVLGFLKVRGMTYIEDASNLDTAFLRNRVRHELLTTLSDKYNPRIVEALVSHATLLGEVEDYLSSAGREAYKKCVLFESCERIELELTAVLSYHPCIQGYLLREAYFRLCGDLKDVGLVHIDSLKKLVRYGQSGESLDLPSCVAALREGERLLLGRRAQFQAEGADVPEFSLRLEPETRAWVPAVSLGVECTVLKRGPVGGVSANSERVEVLFDLSQLSFPLVLRNVAPGDRMKPFGMSGSKKVHDVLVDAKIQRSARRRVAVLCDGDEILWLVGLRRGSGAPVTEKTKSVLRVRASFGTSEQVFLE